MNTHDTIQTKLSLLGTTVLLAGACSTGELPEATAATQPEAPELQAEWVAETPSGSQVTLRPATVPVSVGPVMFYVEFDGEAPDPASLSFDLVSPDMPMMGVRRFPLEPHEGGFMAMTDIPMTGLWNAYVNIGVGTDAAEFAFEVHAAQGGAAHQHGSPPATDTMESTTMDDHDMGTAGTMENDEVQVAPRSVPNQQHD